jgi:thymidylate synthase
MPRTSSNLTSQSYFSGKTIDDLMRDVLEAIKREGDLTSPSKGDCKELRGVILELENSRARLSRTETRGKPFSCLGELCWYLAGSNELAFIEYYIPAYKEWANDGFVIGGYGPRLVNWKGISQLDRVTEVLRSKRDSRQAVVQLFDARDLADNHLSIPCTCTLQFMLRNDKLHIFTNMRSNDAYLGLPHDIFCFTMLQEIIARTLGVEIGVYKHLVGSLHLYDSNADGVQQFLDEGIQSTTLPMPPMPQIDPQPAIHFLLKSEAAIRTDQAFECATLNAIDPYWADLIRLLQVYRFSKAKECDRIEEVRGKMASSTYQVFIDQRLSECRKRLMESHEKA